MNTATKIDYNHIMTGSKGFAFRELLIVVGIVAAMFMVVVTMATIGFAYRTTLYGDEVQRLYELGPYKP